MSAIQKALAPYLDYLLVPALILSFATVAITVLLAVR